MYNTKEKLVIAFFTILNGVVVLVTLGLVDPKLSSRWHTKYAKIANERWRLQRAKELKICPECEFGYSSETEWHRPFCTLQPHNQLIRNMKIYEHNETAWRLTEKRLKEQITFWQGKFNMLRHENNKLRNDKRTKRT